MWVRPGARGCAGGRARIRERKSPESPAYRGFLPYYTLKSQCGITVPHFTTCGFLSITRQISDENCILKSFSIRTFSVDYNKRLMGNLHYLQSSGNCHTIAFHLLPYLTLLNQVSCLLQEYCKISLRHLEFQSRS